MNNKLEIKEKSDKLPVYKVLFVCNGNVFRSISAEVLLKHYLNEHKIKGWKVFSAGTMAKKQEIDPEVISELKMFGAKNLIHKPHKLNTSMLKKFDLVIAMSEDQIDFMKKKFNYTEAVLFNELVNNEKTSIWDVNDTVKDYLTNREGVEKKINETIQYINKNISKLAGDIVQRFQK